jgi:hypothetical protein
MTGCDLIGNIFDYRNTTKEFVGKLLQEDYDGCVDLIALNHEMAANTNVDTMKVGFANFRNLIVKNFGDELNFTFMKSEKKFLTDPGENMAPNTTLVHIQFDNGKEFGVFEVLFDDTSEKILNIRALEVKQAIPDLTLFWLFGLLALCVLTFNIFMIVQIKRSNLNKKWVKYLAIVFLNVPTIVYKAVGSTITLELSLQILLGMSFSKMGYMGTAVEIGIPLGGLYWLWRLKARKAQSIIEPELVGHIGKETKE